MNDVQLISVFDFVSFIVGIASIVISIVAMVLSVLFYIWSKKENESTTRNITRIEEKISFLDKLFDQLYSKAFDAVKSHGDEMQKMLKESIGSTSGANQKNYDLELYLELSKPGTHSVTEISDTIGLDKDKTLEMIKSAKTDYRYIDLDIQITGQNVMTSPKNPRNNEDQVEGENKTNSNEV